MNLVSLCLKIPNRNINFLFNILLLYLPYIIVLNRNYRYIKILSTNAYCICKLIK